MYQALSTLAGQRIWGEDRGFGPGSAMGVFDKNNVVAAVLIFHNYDHGAGIIEFSGAGDNPKWMTRSVLFSMFDYIFNNLGCQAVFTRTSIDHDKLTRIYKWYGFSRHVLPHLRGRGKDEAVYIISDDEWRANGIHKEHKHVQT